MILSTIGRYLTKFFSDNLYNDVFTRNVDLICMKPLYVYNILANITYSLFNLIIT